MTVEQKFDGLYAWSKDENRGVNLLVDGHMVSGIVVGEGTDFIELRNRDHGSIVVRKTSITAVMGK